MGRWLVLLAGVLWLPAAGAAQGSRGEAERSLALAFSQLIAGLPAAAGQAAERALPSYVSLGDLSAQAACLEVIAVAHLTAGRKSEALAAVLDGVARAARAGDDFAVAAMSTLAGRLAADLGRMDEALVALEGARGAVKRLRQKDLPVRWFELHHAGLGVPFVGEPHLDTRYRFGPRDFDLAEATVLYLYAPLRAWHEARRGRLSAALTWNETALRLRREHGDRAGEADLLVTHSRVLNRAGRPEEAEQVLAQAEEVARGSGDPTAIAQVNRAWALRRLGQGKLQETAERLARGSLGTTAPKPCADQAHAAELAAVYATAGLYDEARLTATRLAALPASADCQEVDFFVRLLAVLTGEHGLDRLTELAHQLAEPSSGLLLSPHHLELVPALIGLVQGDAPRAILAEQLEPVLLLIRQRGDRVAEVLARLVRAKLLQKAGELDAAWQEVETARWLAQQESQPNVRHVRISAARVASQIALQRGDRVAAIRALEDAVQMEESVLQEASLDEFLVAMSADPGTTYGALVELLLAAGRNESAFVYAERARARALLRLLEQPATRGEGAGDSALAAEVKRLRGERATLARRFARGELSPPEWRAQSPPLNAEYDEMRLRFELSRASRGVWRPPPPGELVNIRRGLPAETSLVSFFVLPEETVVWLFDAERTETLRLPLPAAELGVLVERLRDQIAAHATEPWRGGEALRPPSGATFAGDELYRRLWEPLEPHLRHSRVIVVPHGVLHTVPFAALRDGSGAWLMERWVLSLLPSVSSLAPLRRPRATAPGAPLVLGDPAVPAAWQLPALAGAHDEASRVGRRLGVGPQLGPRASEAELRRAAPEAPLVHLAAHFVPVEGEPRFGFFALAADDQHDGRLEVHEIFDEIRLTGAQLVVLSACQTGLGPRTDGDEVLSAVRALLDAGGAAVVATLWSIDDTVSAALMDRFYQQLQAGVPAAAALREAQMATRNEHPAPVYWAAFTLTGDPTAAFDRWP